MHPRSYTPKWWVKAVALMLIGMGWVVFGLLTVWSLQRIRCIPGWTKFFAANTSAVSGVCSEWQGVMSLSVFATPPLTVLYGTAPTAILAAAPNAFSPPTRVPLTATTPGVVQVPNNDEPTDPSPTQMSWSTSTPVSPSITGEAQPDYPTQCPQSLPTRLHPGQTGRTSATYNIKIRDTPASNGITLATKTLFETIGEPVCAALQNNPDQILLWWPVRLKSGAGSGRTGWIAESGNNSPDGLIYNVEPFN